MSGWGFHVGLSLEPLLAQHAARAGTDWEVLSSHIDILICSNYTARLPDCHSSVRYNYTAGNAIELQKNSEISYNC